MSSLSKGKPKPKSWKEKMSNRLSGVEKSESHKENMARSRAELTKDQVIEIRDLRLSGLGLKDISIKTGVSWGQCQRICAGERYQWAYDYAGPVDMSGFDPPQRRQYNNTVYRFSHKIHGDRDSTQFELKSDFPELSSSKVSLLCSGKRKIHKGWTLKKAPEGA